MLFRSGVFVAVGAGVGFGVVVPVGVGVGAVVPVGVGVGFAVVVGVVVGAGVGAGVGVGAAGAEISKLAVDPCWAPVFETTKEPVDGVFVELPDAIPFHVAVCVNDCPGCSVSVAVALGVVAENTTEPPCCTLKVVGLVRNVMA